MAKPAELEKLTGLASRFGAFVAERHPFALSDALDAFETATGRRDLRDEAAIEAARPALRLELTKRLQSRVVPEGLLDATPRTTAAARVGQAQVRRHNAQHAFLVGRLHHVGDRFDESLHIGFDDLRFGSGATALGRSAVGRAGTQSIRDTSPCT